MKIKLHVSLKGLIRAIEGGKNVFVGMFERPKGNLGIYMEIEFPLAEVIVTEDVPYAQFPLARFKERERHAFSGGGTIPSEFNFIPVVEPEKVPQAPIEPAPHVAQI